MLRAVKAGISYLRSVPSQLAQGPPRQTAKKASSCPLRSNGFGAHKTCLKSIKRRAMTLPVNLARLSFAGAAFAAGLAEQPLAV